MSACRPRTTVGSRPIADIDSLSTGQREIDADIRGNGHCNPCGDGKGNQRRRDQYDPLGFHGLSLSQRRSTFQP